MNGSSFGWLLIEFVGSEYSTEESSHNVIMGRKSWFSLLLWPRRRRKTERADRRHLGSKCLPLGTFQSMTGFAERIFIVFALCSLFIPSLATDDGWGEVEFVDPTYRVPLEPVFLTTNTNVTVREGGRAELPCRIQHQGTKRIAWRSVDQDRFLIVGTMIWLSDDNLEIQHTKQDEEIDDWTLVIPSVKKTDAGLYECQLTSIGGHHTLVQLNVVGPPITEPAVSLTGTEYVERGALINLTCIASGGLQIAEDIDWFLDGNIISSPRYKDYIITKFRSLERVALVSTLTVDRATEEHAGTYVCRSSHNELKDISVQVLMTVRDNQKREESNGRRKQESAHVISRGTDSSSDSHAPSIGISAMCIMISFVCAIWRICLQS